MQATSLVWQGVTATQVAALIASLPSKGFTVSQQPAPNQPTLDVFAVEGHGVEARVAYDPSQSILTVSQIDKEWYISMGAIHDAIAQALASVTT